MSEVTTPMVSLEIDGKAMQVPQGTMIIEAADNAGITIPRFCYHKKLAIAANCRMCLVDMEKSRKPTPACATPVTEGMKVYTKSPTALKYQKTIMEFLLINHPLDCPICDQGGECELQDLSMGFGKDVSRYNQGKRVVPQKDIGPLVATDLTRCIHCTRCVRFGADIAGERELGMINRGGHSEIESFLSKPLESEMSGNIIDLCPVGALTSKPFRYRARAWELQQKATIAAHDCIGSNIYAHVRRGETMRVAPKENEAINEVWISDRDRFSYEGLNSPLRAKQPMIKEKGQWRAVSWSEAFEEAVKQLKAVIAHEQKGAKQIGGLASPNSTTEELYLFQKVLRGIHCHNMDYRLRRSDFSHQSHEAGKPGIDLSLADVEMSDFILLVGSNVRKEQPMMHHRIRKASLSDAKVHAINPAAFDFRFDNLTQHVTNVDDVVLTLAALLKVLSPQEIPGLSGVTVTPEIKALAEQLSKAQHPVILSGALAQNHSQAGKIFHLLGLIKNLTNAKGGELTDGANTAGAALAGVLPHRLPVGQPAKHEGLNAKEMLTGTEVSAYVLLNIDPALDVAYGQSAQKALVNADAVIALTSFVSDSLKEYATVILPIGTAFETSGTFVNVCGDWQSFMGVATPIGESRPAWKVLRVLANFLEVSGCEYETSEQVLEELKTQLDVQPFPAAQYGIPKQLPLVQSTLTRVSEVPIYATDMMVRYSAPLQATPVMQNMASVSISPVLAKQLGVTVGDRLKVQQQQGAALTLPVNIVEGLADKSVFIPMGIGATAALGGAFDAITMTRV